ncbi:MAG: alpha/beta hydrolase, partial [Rhizobiaceae bacterium]
GRAELLFVDRPGHGWSGRDPARHATPHGHADAIAGLMDRVGIGSALIVGHSFGGAVAAAFALRHPRRTAGLVFLAAASHPWPGARTNWYYRLTVRPLLGPLFARLAALPAGLLLMERTTQCVFSPNRRPDDYVARAGIGLVLRPAAFRANAIDVEGLHAHVAEASPRYGTITAPTVVVTGDRDTVVFEEIHSIGLARDIPGAAYVEVRNLGHKPDWIAPDLVVAAVAKAAGHAVDLDAVKSDVEARIRDDAFGPAERCPDLPPPPG